MGLLSKKKPSEDVQRCTGDVVIDNRNGLHARPAAMFVKISSRYRAEVWVEKDGERVNGKSIMGLLMLACPLGSRVMLKVDVADEEMAFQELGQLIDDGFQEI